MYVLIGSYICLCRNFIFLYISMYTTLQCYTANICIGYSLLLFAVLHFSLYSGDGQWSCLSMNDAAEFSTFSFRKQKRNSAHYFLHIYFFIHSDSFPLFCLFCILNTCGLSGTLYLPLDPLDFKRHNSMCLCLLQS